MTTVMETALGPEILILFMVTEPAVFPHRRRRRGLTLCRAEDFRRLSGSGSPVPCP
ncbi:protein of unknown function (plasmid) [Candidatus Methylocalor cossyra]|uniref:Uncharacterized protein n=1 Tax=Candidatus Methylocalor cossyra TaxID=3108543 RepID=A0ABP1CCZ8_9GAMM